jgi:hypothetical protein
MAAAVDAINEPYRGAGPGSDISGPYDPTLALSYAVPMRTFGSNHPGGCHMVMGDSSVHFISETIDLAVYKQLGARNDELPAGGLVLP